MKDGNICETKRTNDDRWPKNRIINPLMLGSVKSNVEIRGGLCPFLYNGFTVPT